MNELKIFIQLKLEKGLTNLNLSMNKEIKKKLIDQTSHLNDITMMQRAWHVYHDQRDPPKCPECGAIITYFRQWKFTTFCSTRCSSLNKEVQSKLKATCMNKYGAENIYSSQQHKDKLKKLSLEKYGVDQMFKAKEFKDQSKESCLKRYGVEYYTQTNEFKDKFKKTCLEKYGVDHMFKSQEFRDATHDTMLQRYGVEHYTGNTFAFKEYKLPSGKIVKIQGYENKALDVLLKFFHEDEIVISRWEIRALTGKLSYFYQKDRIYTPDFFIISLNKIIEIKSDYTYYKYEEQNLQKEKACLLAGFLYECWIF